MSLHIAATADQIAATVIISGDPLRIQHMAKKYLNDAICFNNIRGMLGYTGYYQGKRVSMFGTGMGIPSTALYIDELANHYAVNQIIRAGTAGAMVADMALGDLLLASSASTDSSFNKIIFNGQDFAPTASYDLLEQAVGICRKKSLPFRVGNVLSTDNFYSTDIHRLLPWQAHGVCGIEMETSVIYTLAARYQIKALSILSVSDNIITHAISTAEEREKSFNQMFEIALELA